MSEMSERFGVIEDRIVKAEVLLARLDIAGDGWAGNSDEGFTFNPKLVHRKFPSGTLTFTFSGESKCCNSIGGVVHCLSASPDVTSTLPNTSIGVWYASGIDFNTIRDYITATCPGGVVVTDFQDNHTYFGDLTITFSGSVWTVKSRTVIGGTNCFDFVGTSNSMIVPNTLLCNGVNLGTGGTCTISF